MPKFYHGEYHGFQYKARAIGIWRRFPFRFLPYLTGDEIRIRLSLKPLSEGQEWQQGILQIEPPNLSEVEPHIRLSDYSFIFSQSQWSDDLSISTPLKYQFPVGQWWSATLPLKSGVSFGQPCNVECFLVFQNVEDNKVIQTTPIKIADIGVISRDSFLTKIYMWLIGLILAGLIGYLVNALM